MQIQNNKFNLFIDSKLQFFYPERRGKIILFEPGLPFLAGSKFEEILARIKPQKDGTKLFEQALVREKSGWPSYNDFQEKDYLKIAPQSFLIEEHPHHEYRFTSKGCSGHSSSCGPKRTLEFILEEMFEDDPTIIAAYSFLDVDGCSDDIIFDDFMITEPEKEKLINGDRGCPNFHGVEVITLQTLKNRQSTKWECFDWLQTIEDAALLEVKTLGLCSLDDVRPRLEWLHQRYIEGEIKNIVQRLE